MSTLVGRDYSGIRDLTKGKQKDASHLEIIVECLLDWANFWRLKINDDDDDVVAERQSRQ